MSEPHVGAVEPWVNVMGSRNFLDWLGEQNLSLAFTTYQTGKLFFDVPNGQAVFRGTQIRPGDLRL